MKIPNDVICQIHNEGNWILYNVFTRNALAVTNESLQVLQYINQKKSEEEICSYFSKKDFDVWEIGKFLNYDGLFADPTRIIREMNDWPKVKVLKIKDFIELLKKNFIIINDETLYNNSFKPKISLLDREHFGNFHQQLGQYLLVEKREDPSEWWVKQKFTYDKKSIKDNLYKAIQENFLKSFFSRRFKSEHSIIDLGCGIGLYTKMMGETGANVLGIDPNEKYIEFAKKENRNNVNFRISKIGMPGSLDWIDSNSVDFIFMSDALLFYFVSPDPQEELNLDDLFSDIRRILKPNGRFFSMEPHGMFFLKPWLGENERPFTIFSEYRNKKFGIVPNISEALKSFIDGGFFIRGFEEIYVDEKFLNKDKRAGHFAKEFPLWWFFELEPLKQFKISN